VDIVADRYTIYGLVDAIISGLDRFRKRETMPDQSNKAKGVA